MSILITQADPASPDARACLAAYAALLADRIPDIGPTHVPDPDPEAHLFRPPLGTFLLAMNGDHPLACVSLKPAGLATGEVKRLWVAPAARGIGLARRMMTAVEVAARALRLTRLILDTNEHLPEAIALYRATGWQDIPPYTPFPATHWFGKHL